MPRTKKLSDIRREDACHAMYLELFSFMPQKDIAKYTGLSVSQLSHSCEYMSRSTCDKIEAMYTEYAKDKKKFRERMLRNYKGICKKYNMQYNVDKRTVGKFNTFCRKRTDKRKIEWLKIALQEFLQKRGVI